MGKELERRLAALALGCAAVVATVAGADQRLPEVLVTAPSARSATEAQDPTAFASVIDATAAPTRVETLADALAETVGVQVRRFGGLGDFSTVSIRGSSAGQVQIYLDGVPLSRAENEVVNLADLPLDAVDHVEVYRGTTPLAFAQAGAGGIVNVVTRRPGDTPLAAGSASYGSFVTRKLDLTGSGRAGAWEALAFAHYLGSAGDFTFLDDHGTPTNPEDDRIQRRKNNAFDLGDLTARLGWRPGGPLAASLTTDSFDKQEGVPGPRSVQALDTHQSTLRQLAHLDLRLTPLGGLPADGEASAYVLYTRRQFTDRRAEIVPGGTDVTDQTTAVGVQALVRSAVGSHQLPGLFLAASHERFAANDELATAPQAPARTRLRGTVAAEDEIVLLGERLRVVPGLRFEVFRDDFQDAPGTPAALRAGGLEVRDFLSPRLGLRAEPRHGLTLLANVGRYPREPNLDELFGTRGVVKGNPSLRPEVAVNKDVGFRLALPARGPLSDAFVEHAFFDNRIDDLILLVQNTQRIVRPVNVSSASVRGHEVTLRGRLWSQVGATANYTHQRSRDEGDVTFRRGTQLAGRPADEAFVHVELDWSAAHPWPLGRRAERLPGRVYYDLDLIAGNFLDQANTRLVDRRMLHAVGVELGLPVPGWRATLEARNLSDDRTSDVFGFPLPGRALFLTLSYGFGRDGPAPGR